MGKDLSLIQPVIDRYKDDESGLIAVLQSVQDLYGYLPEDVLQHISRETGIKPARIMGVATFYTQFRLQPSGKYLIMLCKGTACHVNSADAIEAAIENELHIKNGETTADGLFTLKTVACLGCCSLSPVMMINGETYGSLTPDKTVSVLRRLAKGE